MDKNKLDTSSFALTYINFESEIEQLAYDIQVDDNQLSVYSAHIANLIVSICSEIEAIAKYICAHTNGSIHNNHSKFDHDCLASINDISKKAVFIYTNKFSLIKPENTILLPFRKNELDQFKDRYNYPWNISYQHIKHDKLNSIQKFGTIRYMLSALSALYILIEFGSPTQFQSPLLVDINSEGRYARKSIVSVCRSVDDSHLMYLKEHLKND